MMKAGLARQRAMAMLIEKHRDEFNEMVADLRGISARECSICGRLHRRSVETCSAWCADTWRILRQHVGEHRERQRVKNARGFIRHAQTPAEKRKAKAYAQRVADGTAAFHGRWLLVGSETYDRALECARRSLPIVGLLPEQIQEQLAEALAA